MSSPSSTKTAEHESQQHAECSSAEQSCQQGSAGPYAGILRLQRAVGNRTINQIIQAKLNISRPGDQFEQEADRVADQALALPAHPAVSEAPPHIQRFAGQPTGQADIAPASVDRVLASPGRPLDSALRQDMEQRFGHDFSRVRVHSGAAAEQSAREVNANAYTAGHDIVFGEGRFVPGTPEGPSSTAPMAVQREPQSASAPVSGLTLQPPSPLKPGGALSGKQPDPSFQLRLTPEFKALALQHIQNQLDPTFLASVLARARLGTTLPPPPNVQVTGVVGAIGPIGPPAPPKAPVPPQPVPEAEPQPSGADTRLKDGPGTTTDILDAVKASPEVQQALGGLSTKVRDRWSRLSTGEGIGVISTLALIGGGGAGGVLADPARRQWAFDHLNGRVWPVPGVNWLRVEVNVTPANLLVGIHVDVGALLPPSLGFAPSPWSPGPLGSPPRTDGPVPGQRLAVQSSLSLSPQAEDVGQRVRAAAGGGSALDSGMQNILGQRLGADLTRVRVHTDSEADHLARSVDAVAFTSGQDIFFSSGAYNPTSSSGLRLLAHETIHTVQQAAGPVAGTPGPGGVSVSSPADRFEKEAHQISERVAMDSDTATTAPLSQFGPAVAWPLVVSQAPAGQLFRQPQGAAAPGQSAAGEVTGVVGVPTTSQVIEANATIGAGQTIFADADATIHTITDTHVSVRATNTYIIITFNPQLVITPESGSSWIPNPPNIYLYSLLWDFATQQITPTISAPRAVLWAGASKKIHKAIGAQVDKLPDRIRTRGYDPFADPQLPADLKTLATNLTTPSGGAKPNLNIPAVGLAAEVVLGEEIKQTFGRGSLVVPRGTRIRLSATAAGGLPTTPSDLRIGEVALTLSGGGGGAEVNLRALDKNLPLVEVTSATLHSGGRFQLSYRLITEDLETIFKAFVAVEAFASGQGDKLGDNPIDGQQPRIHALIDAVVRQHVEQLLRGLILANRGAIAGVDLAKALGLDVPPSGQPPTSQREKEDEEKKKQAKLAEAREAQKAPPPPGPPLLPHPGAPPPKPKFTPQNDPFNVLGPPKIKTLGENADDLADIHEAQKAEFVQKADAIRKRNKQPDEVTRHREEVEAWINRLRSTFDYFKTKGSSEWVAVKRLKYLSWWVDEPDGKAALLRN